MSFIQTSLGREFDFLDPRPEDICIHDIAHSLSLQCRYTGHCRHFYSVAQHSILMSYQVSPSKALEALLHDATEAYIGDMAKPLKNLIPEFNSYEEKVWGVIAEKYGLREDLSAEVKEADMRMLFTERKYLLPPTQTPWVGEYDYSPYDMRIIGWSPTYSEQKFLERFEELVPLQRKTA